MPLGGELGAATNTAPSPSLHARGAPARAAGGAMRPKAPLRYQLGGEPLLTADHRPPSATLGTVGRATWWRAWRCYKHRSAVRRMYTYAWSRAVSSGLEGLERSRAVRVPLCYSVAYEYRACCCFDLQCSVMHVMIKVLKIKRKPTS